MRPPRPGFDSRLLHPSSRPSRHRGEPMPGQLNLLEGIGAPARAGRSSVPPVARTLSGREVSHDATPDIKYPWSDGLFFPGPVPVGRFALRADTGGTGLVPGEPFVPASLAPIPPQPHL